MSPAKKPRVFLIHWRDQQAPQKLARLEAAGYLAEFEPFEPQVIRRLRENPPLAVVIDLSRLPSRGREVGMLLRQQKSTRHIPLVFVGGADEKIKRVRSVLPDATYTSWRGIRSALKHAVACPLRSPTVPASIMDAYAGTPLTKKLGIEAGSVVTLVAAPKDIEQTLGRLPDNVVIKRRLGTIASLIIWFAKSQADLEARLTKIQATLAENGRLWIAWPKKSSGVVSDLTQNKVRQTGLASGLVDYKICAIDTTWSGLLFRHRKPK